MSDVEYDAEQEIDLRSLWERLALRWWLPVGGLALGLVIGILLALAGGTVYRAETLIFLGQPFTPQGGGQIQSLATNPRTVAEIVRSEAAIRAAARASGLRPGQLRGRVATEAITSPGQTRTTTPLVQIAVVADGPRKAERAADALAARVLARVSSYVEDKIAVLKEQIASDESQIAEINKRLAVAQQQQAQVLADKSLSIGERTLFVTSLNSTLAAGEQRRGTLQEDLLQARQLLSLAEKVERSHVVEPAAAFKTSARGGRTAAVVGGLIGLLVGVLAALAAEPVLARRSAARS